MAELRIEQRHHMTEWAERARFFIDLKRARQLRHQVRRNQFDQLPQDRRLPPSRLLPYAMGRLWSVTRFRVYEAGHRPALH